MLDKELLIDTWYLKQDVVCSFQSTAVAVSFLAKPWTADLSEFYKAGKAYSTFRVSGAVVTGTQTGSGTDAFLRGKRLGNGAEAYSCPAFSMPSVGVNDEATWRLLASWLASAPVPEVRSLTVWVTHSASVYRGDRSVVTRDVDHGLELHVLYPTWADTDAGELQREIERPVVNLSLATLSLLRETNDLETLLIWLVASGLASRGGISTRRSALGDVLAEGGGMASIRRTVLRSGGISLAPAEFEFYDNCAMVLTSEEDVPLTGNHELAQLNRPPFRALVLGLEAALGTQARFAKAIS